MARERLESSKSNRSRRQFIFRDLPAIVGGSTLFLAGCTLEKESEEQEAVFNEAGKLLRDESVRDREFFLAITEMGMVTSLSGRSYKYKNGTLELKDETKAKDTEERPVRTEVFLSSWGEISGSDLNYYFYIEALNELATNSHFDHISQLTVQSRTDSNKNPYRIDFFWKPDADLDIFTAMWEESFPSTDLINGSPASWDVVLHSTSDFAPSPGIKPVISEDAKDFPAEMRKDFFALCLDWRDFIRSDMTGVNRSESVREFVEKNKAVIEKVFQNS